MTSTNETSGTNETTSHAKARVLLISHDIIGKAMAGPGIRYYNLARVLGKHTDLILAASRQEGRPVDIDPASFNVQKIITFQDTVWSDIEAEANWADVIICPSDIPHVFRELHDMDAAIVIDGYDPLLPEYLAIHSDRPLDEQIANSRGRLKHLYFQYMAGDFYICASERQRNWWLGQLQVAGRINPQTFGADQTLRSLVDIVPFGLPEAPPQHTKQMVKGIWPGIEPTDKLLLWGGGLWAWLDSITAIRAVAKIQETRTDVKLIFPGTKHPNPALDDMQTQNQLAFDTARELGVFDTAVFFGEWIPREDWPNLVLECDIALSLHYDSVETQLAFRSRVIDYIWASLPIVATTGDATSELVLQHDLGIVVDYEDVDAVAVAILQLLDEPTDQRQPQFDTAREALTWERVAEPLINFCRNPQRAPDRRIDQEQQESYIPAAEIQTHDLRVQYQTHIEHLEATVQAYERGKFITTMRKINQVRNRLLGKSQSGQSE